jgi:hypothetical protein
MVPVFLSSNGLGADVAGAEPGGHAVQLFAQRRHDVGFAQAGFDVRAQDA